MARAEKSRAACTEGDHIGHVCSPEIWVPSKFVSSIHQIDKIEEMSQLAVLIKTIKKEKKIKLKCIKKGKSQHDYIELIFY